MKRNGKSTTPIIAAHAKKNNGKQPAPPSEGKSNGTKRVSRASNKAAAKMKCQMMERINDGLIAFDSEMNYTYVNEQAAKILGREVQDLIGRNFLEVYPDLIGRPFVDVCRRAFETQTVIPFDGYFAPSNTWFEARIYPSSDGISILLREGRNLDGSPGPASYSFHGVSEFPEQNPNPVMRFTRDGKLLYANSASASLLASWQGQTRHNLPIEMQELLFIVSETGSNKEIELASAGVTYSCLLVPVQESGYVNLYFSDITERKQTEQTLARERILMERLFETMPVMVSMYDPKTKSMRWNAEFERTIGWKTGEVSPTLLLEVLYPDPEYRADVLKRMAAAGNTQEWVEVRLQTRQGRSIDSLWANISIMDDEQLVAGIAIGIDITERKHAEDQLRELSQRLTYHVDNSPLAVIEWGPDMRLTRWSGIAERMFGWKAEEVLGKHMEDFPWVYKEDVQQVNDVSTDLQTGNDIHRFSLNRNYRKDGSVAYCEWYNSSLVDESGKLHSILSLVLDVTERKQMEDALRESEARLTVELSDSKQLQHISSQLIHEDNIQILYQQIVASAMAIMRADAGSMQMLFPEKNELELLAWEGFHPDAAAFWSKVNANSGASCGEALRVGKQIIITNVETSDVVSKEDLEYYHLSRIKSVQSTPLVSRTGSVVGMISTHWQEVHEPSEHELELLNVLTRQAADLIERKQGEWALVEYARQQSALYKLVDQLHSADSLSEVFDASLDAIISALQCDRASILLFDETKIMHFAAWRDLSEEYRRATDGHSPWMYGEENPMPIWYDDVNSSDLSDSLKAAVANEGIGSLAFIPLVFQDALIGKFMVYYNTPHVFTESEINLSQTIGRQLAASLDRKRAEERLRSSEDRLRLAVAAGNIGIWDIDLVRRDRAWSKDGKAIYGLAEDDFLDFERQIELTHPDDRAYVDEMVRAFRDQGTIKQLNLEHRIVRPDGSVRWVEVQGEAVYQDKPLPVRLIGTIVDITERKLIEDALRQSEERFAQFMQYLPGLAWIKDFHGRYVFANAAAEKAFATPRDELYGKTDMEVFPAEVAAQFMKNDDLALTEAKSIQVIETLEQDDGVLHYSMVTKFPIPGVNGKPALIGGTAFDITEQRQMEIALRESEERYRALVNQATAGIVRKDPSGKLIFVNDAFCEMLGYSVSELQGKTMWQITHPEDVSENRRLYNLLMTQGVPFKLEKRLLRNDGSVIWATVSVSPVLDEHGKPDSAVSVYADITERKRAESRLGLLAEVSDLTRRLEDPVDLMASVADVVGKHFQVKRCLFNEIDLANDREIVHRDYHNGLESVAGTHTLTEYSSITTQEMIAGKTVVNFDSKIDPRTASDYERSYVPNGERAYIAIPLTRENRWVASLWISDDKPRPWSEEDVALLQAIAERTWTATERLRINAALRDSEESLRKLNTELEERVQHRTAELQAANEFLRDSEATSRLILESMPDAILIADQEGHIVYCNTQVEHLFGYTPQEVIGQPVEVLIPQRFHNKHVDNRSTYGQNPHRRYMGWDRELFGQRKNQSEFPVDVMLSPIANNTNWDVMVTIRDNTEQKQAQQALRANEEKLRKLFQVLPVGTSFLDNQGKITEMNSALTDILGLSKHELLEGKFGKRRYIRSDGSPMLPSEFASVRAREEQRPIYNVETGIIKEDGSLIWTSVNAAPVDVAGVEVVVATIDITERKKAEEALHKHRERLRILSRRLVEVQEEERRSLARELHDRVGQNLAALNLNLNILRGQLTSTALLEVGQRLSDSVNLVNQILTITRNVMGDLRSDVLDDYGLEAALREFAEKFTARTGVQVIFDKSAKLIARTDASIEMTLLRIAQEALTNVAKHAQAKQATVLVSGDNEAVYMSIQDDGIGILSWQRANQPGSHGLRIIRERAEAFGGSLQVQSTYKKGTRIDVKIPLTNLSQSTISREKHS